jgi:hypothetical protein
MAKIFACRESLKLKPDRYHSAIGINYLSTDLNWQFLLFFHTVPDGPLQFIRHNLVTKPTPQSILSAYPVDLGTSGYRPERGNLVYYAKLKGSGRGAAEFGRKLRIVYAN